MAKTLEEDRKDNQTAVGLNDLAWANRHKAYPVFPPDTNSDAMTNYIDKVASGVFDETKDTNPKYAEGMKKIPLANVPPILTAYASIAFHEGLLKYGAWNWRAKGASAKTYIAAAKRHLDLWLEGEENDSKTGSPHLGNALACIGIILDARICGVLEDDRPPASNYSAELDKLNSQVQNLNSIFGHMTPVHYTIQWKQENDSRKNDGEV